MVGEVRVETRPPRTRQIRNGWDNQKEDVMYKAVLAMVAGMAVSNALAQSNPVVVTPAPEAKPAVVAKPAPAAPAAQPMVVVGRPMLALRPSNTQSGVLARDEQSVLRYNVDHNLFVDVSNLIANQRRQAEREGDNANNGRAWSGRDGTNMTERDARDTGAASSHGAAGQEDAVILVHVGHRHTAAINPFEPVGDVLIEGQRLPMETRRKLEDARQRWLRDNGYTGGVRTFTNEHAEPAPKATKIEPRGVIELNPEVTKFKSRMQVRATEPKADSVVKFTPTKSTGEEKVNSVRVATIQK